MEVGIDVARWGQKWRKELIARAVGLRHGRLAPGVAVGFRGFLKAWQISRKRRHAKKCEPPREPGEARLGDYSLNEVLGSPHVNITGNKPKTAGSKRWGNHSPAQ